MSYALVTDDAIQNVGPLPQSARRLDTGQWVLGLRDADTEKQQATGWHEIAPIDQPADTETTTHDRSIELVAGVPTVVWTERDKTDEETNPPPTDAERIADLEAVIAALLEVE
jgi:hypothetical protein